MLTRSLLDFILKYISQSQNLEREEIEKAGLEHDSHTPFTEGPCLQLPVSSVLKKRKVQGLISDPMLFFSGDSQQHLGALEDEPCLQPHQPEIHLDLTGLG